MQLSNKPTQRIFLVKNWFAWIPEARDAGYSQADMRWILNTVGVMSELRRVIEADEDKRTKETPNDHRP